MQHSISIFTITTLITITACKIERTPTAEELAAASDIFNADKLVDEIWAAKVMPYLNKIAGDFNSVRELELVDKETAGSKFGHKQKVGNAPWTYIVRLEGEVITANIESRAATVDVDSNADGQVDAKVQIGPAIRGTALRDSLNFLSFNDFTNQIDYAKFGKAFNVRARDTFLKQLPREDLVGKKIKLLGTYQYKPSQPVPLITPAELETVTSR